MQKCNSSCWLWYGKMRKISRQLCLTSCYVGNNLKKDVRLPCILVNKNYKDAHWRKLNRVRAWKWLIAGETEPPFVFPFPPLYQQQYNQQSLNIYLIKIYFSSMEKLTAIYFSNYNQEHFFSKAECCNWFKQEKTAVDTWSVSEIK